MVELSQGWKGTDPAGGEELGFKASLCLVGLAGGVSCHLTTGEDENVEVGSKKS